MAVADGLEYRFTIAAIDGDLVRATVDGVAPAQGEPGHPVILLQALLPHGDFDSVLEAGTQVGITRFIPVTASRSVGRAGADRAGRWHAIVEAAAAQSQRGAIPVVDPPRSLADALGSIRGTRLFALDPDAGATLPKTGLREAVAIAVGPEGGWTAEELEAMVAAGATRVGLGPRILRARLAGVIAAAILL